MHLEVWIVLKPVPRDEPIPADCGLAPFRAAIRADTPHTPHEIGDSRIPI
jgi:hypothetical protein